MSDKEIIEHYKEIVAAQEEAIKALLQMVKMQRQPTVTYTSRSPETYGAGV